MLLERRSGSGDDDEIIISLPGVVEEFVKEAGLNVILRGEDSGVKTGGLENLLEEAGNDNLAGGASDNNELHVLDRVAIVGAVEFGLKMGDLRLEGGRGAVHDSLGRVG